MNDVRSQVLKARFRSYVSEMACQKLKTALEKRLEIISELFFGFLQRLTTQNKLIRCNAQTLKTFDNLKINQQECISASIAFQQLTLQPLPPPAFHYFHEIKIKTWNRNQ